MSAAEWVTIGMSRAEYEMLQERAEENDAASVDMLLQRLAIGMEVE